MHIKPLLSICIPAYNRPQILLESVESMITQIKKNSLESKIEIVIVDDSTHSPVTSIIPWLVAKFPSIVYHKNEKNLWRVNTVTHIQYAHGDYILMIADDDMLTDFALPYIIDLIEKTSFDLLLHQPLFTENMDIHIPQISNTYKHFSGIDDLLAHIANAGKTYQQLVSYFSFYSSIVAKSSYLLDALANTNQEAIKKNYFPHEFLTYYNLQDKTIIFPDNVFMKWKDKKFGSPQTMPETDIRVGKNEIKWVKVRQV